MFSVFFLQGIFQGAYFLWDGPTRSQLLRLDNIIPGASTVYDMYQEPGLARIEFTIEQVVYPFLSLAHMKLLYSIMV